MNGEGSFNSSQVVITEKLSSQGYMATGIYLTVLGVVALFGNTCVILVVLMKRMLCKSFNHLILNLALADLCVGIIAYPMTAASGFAERWLFGEFGCIFSAYIIFLLSMVSINTMLVIAIFRYTFVCKPQYNYLTNVEYMKFVIGGIWGHALIWTSLPLVGWSSYTLEPYGTSCTLNWQGTSLSDFSYSISSLVTCYIIHIVIITFCYVKITFKARSLRFGLTSNERFLEMEKLLVFQKMQVERNVTMICIVMVTSYLTVWTPYALFSLLSVLRIKVPVAASCLPTMFAKLSCALNPIIYTVGSSRFRHALASVVPCCRPSSRLRTRSGALKYRHTRFTTIVNTNDSCVGHDQVRTSIAGRNK
ncbi:rhodopsin, G0-coupled-like [Haliotis rufescens]|uniref:rhodopsin, G0-coupled-like n=1 Tax=Haliotis rufescens TaxID=6454 RepID=UPI001EB0191A|nr:rhodopsin, G0-coupled-like [Haliotis rufescens]